MFKELPLVVVHWVDAECNGVGWMDTPDFQKWIYEPLRAITTAGWLVLDTDDRVVVVSTMGGSEMGEAHKIPKSWVVRIEKLTREAIDGGSMPDTKWSVVEHPRPGP